MTKLDLFKTIKSQNKADGKLKLISYWGLLSFLLCFFIRSFIRTQHYKFTGILDFLQGTLPNFFAATGFCALAYLYHQLFFGINANKVTLNKKLVFAFLFSFVGLTLWEVIQYLLGYKMDVNDVLMTALGSIITVVFIWLNQKDR